MHHHVLICLPMNDKHTYNDEPTVSQCVCVSACVDLYQSIFFTCYHYHQSIAALLLSQKCNHATSVHNCSCAALQISVWQVDIDTKQSAHLKRIHQSDCNYSEANCRHVVFSPQSHTYTRAHLCISCGCWSWLISWEIIPEAHSLCTVCLTNFQGRD